MKTYNQIPDEERRSGKFSDETISAIQSELKIAFWARHKQKMLNSSIHTVCSYVLATFCTVAIFWDKKSDPQFFPAMKAIVVLFALVWAFHFIYFNTLRVIEEFPTKKRVVKFLCEIPDMKATNCRMTV